MNLEDFRKIKYYQSIGLSQIKVARQTGLTTWQVKKCWSMNENEFKNSLTLNASSLESYREYIMEILRFTPTIPDTNIFYKIKEDYPESTFTESVFRKYMKRLREETGYDRFRKKSTTIRENPEPGEEAQIDFGQYKMVDLYGKKRVVYFFVMVLRYSQLKYVFFSTTDFNTILTIEAHKNAFKFFGGVPKVLMYDQDKVFLVSENYGSLVMVKEFEEFIKQYNLSIVMCSGYQPQGKGTVENYVKIVKDHFLMGRTYTGIDSLNSACLEWLDNTENNHILSQKGVTPHNLFVEESKYLNKFISNNGFVETPIHLVKSNYIKYRYSKYEVPVGYNDMEVLVECNGVNVIIKDKETEQIIAVHKLSTKKDERMTLQKDYDVDGVGEYVVKHYFQDDKVAVMFLSNLQSKQNRYFRKGCVKIRSMMKVYSKEEMLESFSYCVNNDTCTILEFASYLLYKYGEERAKLAIEKSNFAYYKKRALEIKEELNGNE